MKNLVLIFIFIFAFAGCAQKEEASGLVSGPLALPEQTEADEEVVVDLPDVFITSAANINNANISMYSVTGTCSEQGQTIEVNVDSVSSSTVCMIGSFVVASLDLSALSDGDIAVTAKHYDAQGVFNTHSLTVTKDTANAVVSVNSMDMINSINQTDYTITGTCSENNVLVDVNIGAINKQPLCASGTWSTGLMDVSSLVDGTISVTADHSNATQASGSVEKDVTSAVVTIDNAVDISSSNQATYLVSGQCTANATLVDVNIGSVNVQPTCSSGTWSSGFVDVSTLDDGNVVITVDHATASQASVTIEKATATPSVASLSVPTSLVNSVDLNWNLSSPGGFTIDDYVIHYRVKGTSVWLLFDDGVSTNTETTVASLNPSTTYEFKAMVKYDTTEESGWSNIAEGTTQPDSDVFGANKAMNVGGATASTVVAYQDDTNVTLNGSALITLNKGQSHQFTSAQFDIIDADKPIFTAGKIGTGSGSNDNGNIVWQPTAWAGKSFSFNATRSNPQEVYVYAIEDTTVEVKQGATVLDTLTLSADQSGTLNWSTYGSYQVVATGSVLAFHMSRQSGLYYDPKPLMPGHTEIIGFPSNSMRLTTMLDGTSYNLIHSNSVAGSGSLNKSDVVQVNPQGTGSFYQSNSLLIMSSKSISGASFADSDGYCAAPFMPTNLMKKKYIIPVVSDYIAFASKEAGTIDVLDSSDNLVTTLTLARTGADPNAPYKVRMANPSAGYRFVSTVDVAAWYQSNTASYQGIDDETILYGTND